LQEKRRVMYAVIESGGKQYKVSPGDYVRLEKLPVEPGQEVVFDRVLLVSAEQGLVVDQERLGQAKVVGQVVEQGRGPKILVLKSKRRKNYRRKRGHRQYFTGVKIKKISLEGVADGA